jgi:hypothetical protein
LCGADGDVLYIDVDWWYEQDPDENPYPPELGLFVRGIAREVKRSSFKLYFPVFDMLSDRLNRAFYERWAFASIPADGQELLPEHYQQYELAIRPDVPDERLEDSDDDSTASPVFPGRRRVLRTNELDPIPPIAYDSGSGDEESDTESGIENGDDNEPDEQVPQSDWVAGDGPVVERAPFSICGDNRWNRKFGEKTPVEVLLKLFPPDLLHSIVEYTNTRLCAPPHSRAPLTYSELLLYLGIVAGMVLHKLPRQSLYWQNTEIGLVRLPDFGTAMSLDRFQRIRRCLRFNDPTAPVDQSDPYHKMRPVITALQHAVRQAMPYPGEYLAMDEGRIPFKGRFCCKTVIPSKPIKVGMTMYMLVDYETKFLCDFAMDDRSITAANTNRLEHPYGATGRLVLRFADELVRRGNTGHTIVTDNLYTSPSLARALLDRRLYCIGTMRAMRGAPPEAKLPSVKPTRECPSGTLRIFHDATGRIHLYSWMDKGPVLMLDTAFGPVYDTVWRRTGNGDRRIQYRVPLACAVYNKKMGGVDQFDQRRCTYYGVEMHGKQVRSVLSYHVLKVVAHFRLHVSQVKWTLRVFEALFDVALTNTCIVWETLYRGTAKEMTHFELLATIHEGLIRVGTQGRTLRPSLTSVERNPHKHVISGMTRQRGDGRIVYHQRKCVMCPPASHKNEFRVATGCKECGVWLCRNHFLAHHVQAEKNGNKENRRIPETEVEQQPKRRRFGAF